MNPPTASATTTQAAADAAAALVPAATPLVAVRVAPGRRRRPVPRPSWPR
ncbi:MAG: hypothetical protein L6367_10215 [Cellulomonas sp.]|nr:hypothetical protein [Cellulomonas sp.]